MRCSDARRWPLVSSAPALFARAGTPWSTRVRCRRWAAHIGGPVGFVGTWWVGNLRMRVAAMAIGWRSWSHLAATPAMCSPRPRPSRRTPTTDGASPGRGWIVILKPGALGATTGRHSSRSTRQPVGPLPGDAQPPPGAPPTDWPSSAASASRPATSGRSRGSRPG